MNEQARQVLIVDDAESNRRLIASLLVQEEYVVAEAETGESAVSQSSENSFDIILMDVNLPGIDGIEATRQIRANSGSPSSHSRIIGISAHASERDRLQFRKAGMDDCLPKPIDLNQLIATLKGQATNSNAGDVSDSVSLVLDIVSALRRIGSDQDLFRRFVQMFRSDIGQLLSDAEQAAAENNTESLAGIAHRIRGMAANLSANAVTDAATELENSCEQDDMNSAKAKFDDLKAAIAKLENEFVNQKLID